MVSRKSFAHSSIDAMQDVSGKSVTDPIQMSDIFDEYFANVPVTYIKPSQERQTLPLDILAVLLKTLCFFLQSLI